MRTIVFRRGVICRGGWAALAALLLAAYAAPANQGVRPSSAQRAVLLATNGVIPLSGAQSCGALATNAAAIAPTLQLT